MYQYVVAFAGDEKTLTFTLPDEGLWNAWQAWLKNPGGEVPRIPGKELGGKGMTFPTDGWQIAINFNHVAFVKCKQTTEGEAGEASDDWPVIGSEGFRSKV